jgi:hypothetical protein
MDLAIPSRARIRAAIWRAPASLHCHQRPSWAGKLVDILFALNG